MHTFYWLKKNALKLCHNDTGMADANNDNDVDDDDNNDADDDTKSMVHCTLFN